VDVEHAIRGLRVVREFRDAPLPPELIDRIVGAGRLAGSSKNLQRWTFIVVADRETLRRLASFGPYAGHLAGAATAVALVTPDPAAAAAPLSVMWDLGRAAQNMVLAALDLGVGSCPATVYEHDLAREILGYPSDHHCEYLLSFGYPLEAGGLTRPPRAGGRRDAAEVIRHERW
jgi:nitroreductase